MHNPKVHLINLQSLNTNVQQSNTQIINKEETSNNNLKFQLNNEPIFVFDLNDTLYDFTGIYLDTYLDHIHLLAESKGISNAKSVTEEYYYTYGHESVGLLKHHNIKTSEFVLNVDKIVFSNQIVPLNNKLIELFSKLKYKKYIFSNCEYSCVLSLLKQLDIINYIEGIIVPDFEGSTFALKPAKEAFLFAQDIINSNLVYFFDDSKDNVEMGRSMNWKSYITTYLDLESRVSEAVSEITQQ